MPQNQLVLDKLQMIRVISSASSSTTGFFTWIFGIDIIPTCGAAPGLVKRRTIVAGPRRGKNGTGSATHQCRRVINSAWAPLGAIANLNALQTAAPEVTDELQSDETAARRHQ